MKAETARYTGVSPYKAGLGSILAAPIEKGDIPKRIFTA
jgi:hypothetical protein